MNSFEKALYVGTFVASNFFFEINQAFSQTQEKEIKKTDGIAMNDNSSSKVLVENLKDDVDGGGYDIEQELMETLGGLEYDTLRSYVKTNDSEGNYRQIIKTVKLYLKYSQNIKDEKLIGKSFNLLGIFLKKAAALEDDTKKRDLLLLESMNWYKSYLNLFQRKGNNAEVERAKYNIAILISDNASSFSSEQLNTASEYILQILKSRNDLLNIEDKETVDSYISALIIDANISNAKGHKEISLQKFDDIKKIALENGHQLSSDHEVLIYINTINNKIDLNLLKSKEEKIEALDKLANFKSTTTSIDNSITTFLVETENRILKDVLESIKIQILDIDDRKERILLFNEYERLLLRINKNKIFLTQTMIDTESIRDDASEYATIKAVQDIQDTNNKQNKIADDLILYLALFGIGKRIFPRIIKGAARKLGKKIDDGSFKDSMVRFVCSSPGLTLSMNSALAYAALELKIDDYDLGNYVSVPLVLANAAWHYYEYIQKNKKGGIEENFF